MKWGMESMACSPPLNTPLFPELPFLATSSNFHRPSRGLVDRPDDFAELCQALSNGEPIPTDLLNKAIRANKFNKGFDTLEYLSAALLDLAWHSLDKNEIPVDVEAFEQTTLKRYGVDFAPVPPRYKTPYFAHIWSGGYSASYYAYLWSEVLAADAFAYMRSRGGLTRENGISFRQTILSRGGTRK